MALFQQNPKPVSGTLLQKASMVANLSGWGSEGNGRWYRWLSPDEVLLYKDNTTDTSTAAEKKTKAPVPEEMLYRLPVRAGRDAQALLVQQKPEVLSNLSRSIQESRTGKGGASPSDGSISPDGRYLLCLGRHVLKEWNGIRDSAGNKLSYEYHWCAFAMDGSQEIDWLIKLPPQKFRGMSTRPRIVLTQAEWLPDSSGILETAVDYSKDLKSVTIIGQIRLLKSPDIIRSLPSLHLGKLPEISPFVEMSPIRMIKIPGGRTITLYPQNHAQAGDPSIATGGTLKKHPPDQGIIFQWDWIVQSRLTPSVHKEIIIMPPGYDIFDKAISRKGDRIVWALMDRVHHAVTIYSDTIHRRFGNGKIGLWVSGTKGGTGIQEIGYLSVPLGTEIDFCERFRLGDWLPGDRHISFQYDSILYTVQVP